LNRTLSYVLLSIGVLCVLLIPRLLDSHQGWITFIDDVIGTTVLFLGFFLFRKRIQHAVSKLDQKVSWNINPIERFGLELFAIAKWTFGLGGALMLVLLSWFHFFGTPSFIKTLDRQHAEWVLKSSHPLPPQHHPVFDDQHDYLLQGHPKEFRPPAPVKRDSAWYFIEEIFGVSFLLFLLLFGTEEVFALNHRIQKRALDEERQIKNEAVSKYAALQQQLNPHFMFNTLNVLIYFSSKNSI